MTRQPHIGFPINSAAPPKRRLAFCGDRRWGEVPWQAVMPTLRADTDYILACGLTGIVGAIRIALFLSPLGY